MNTKLPLVVILGATGCGKTKLSLELAQRFGGEIISADSMQIYRELNIITAKATAVERSLAPHHMIDILHPHQIYTVVEFRDNALAIINEMFQKSKLPIVVGGTNYYIESLLWKILVEEPGNLRLMQPWVGPLNDHELPSAELHKKLLAFDPIRAQQLHPNNKRKILRSLEVLYQKGRTHSEILQEQRASDGGSSLGGGLRFTNALILWLQCNQDVLDKRLDDRVDSMLEQGLINELMDFHRKYNEHRLKSSEIPDYTKGVFQSIGFKEFHKYLMMSPLERASDDGKGALQSAIEELKRVTRRYARKQQKWITNRFLRCSDRKVPPVYGLDTTNVEAWDQCVSAPAVDIVDSFVSGRPNTHPALPRLDDKAACPNSKDETFVCEVCERVFIGKFQWECHLKSHKHKRTLQRKQKITKIADEFNR